MGIPDKWKFGNKLKHLVLEFKDDGKDLVVYKYWLASKQEWVYKAEEKWLIEYEIDLQKDGRI